MSNSDQPLKQVNNDGNQDQPLKQVNDDPVDVEQKNQTVTGNDQPLKQVNDSPE